MLGPIRTFEYREGYVYNWPVASDFMFKKDAAGGGALIDTGAHTLDAILWWLGDVERFEYYDDAEGGVDADCEIHLMMSCGATGLVELSRTRNLPNRIILRGDRGTLDARPGEVLLIVDGYRLTGMVDCPADPAQSDHYVPMITASLQDWLDAIRHGREPLVTGAEGRRSVALIEACYRDRQPLAYPWLRVADEAKQEVLS
jgi:predicted dehydrogenase